MKKILFFSAAWILIAGGITQAQQNMGGTGQGMPPDPMSWDRYTVRGEEFSVLLPTLPAMTTTKGLRSRDQKNQSQRHLKTSFDGVDYIIDVFENPKPRQSLDEFIAEQKANGEFDPASERRLVIYGVPGKEFSSANKNSPAVVQFFVTEKRLYRFVASGPKVDGLGARTFFSSIKLGEKTVGMEVSDGPGRPVDTTADRVMSGKEITTKAQLVEKPEPSFTNEARAKNTSGTVILRVVFTKYGTVENIRVVQGLPDGLTERAIEAAKQIKFIPATKDGRPVSMWMQLEYNFLFKDGPGER
ncbi:MAG TPA: energy transducer TonB [Pyrinomonadaceae bacterium]|nr:energy transducer TonB [Pyrinomonadaceae bacterium]